MTRDLQDAISSVRDGEDGELRASEGLPEENFEDRYEIEGLVEALESGAGHVQALGTSGAFRASALADLSQRLRRPLAILTPEPDDAERLASDLRLFASNSETVGPAVPPEQLEEAGFDDIDEAPVSPAYIDEVVHLTNFDIGPYHQASTDRQLRMNRLGGLYKLTRDRPPRYPVASVPSAIRKTMPVEAMELYSQRFEVGDRIANDEFRALLSSCGYTEVPVVEDPGTFAIRGDIVDLYPPTQDHPVRLERWGDEISDIRAFNAETQQTVFERSHCDIFPVREEVLDDPAVELANERLNTLADDLEYPSREVQQILEDLRAGIHFIGIESMLPALHEEMADLFDYLDDDTLLVLVDPDGGLDALQELWENRRAEYERAMESDELVFPVERYYRAPENWTETVKSRDQRLEMRRVALQPADEGPSLPPPETQHSFEFRARPNTDVVKLRKQTGRAEQTVEKFGEHLQSWKERYGRICIACRTPGQADRLINLLQSFGEDALDLPTPIDVTEPVPPPADLIEVYEADLSEGFRSELLGMALVSGSELFGKRVVTESERSMTEHAEISHFRDLSIGDHIVHVDFGIGRYCGLAHLEVEGVENDFLHIEYANGDKLYLPVYRLGRVQKYIGSDEMTRLDTLGGNRWENTKERVKEEIREIAGDLLKLYAEREMADGYAFSSPDEYFQKFEAAFPYEETPDQASAIDDVLEDMQESKPMDRLICGDVGFGKTEVAIRGAMLAALDDKQIAVLVPTTILCEQHRLTFTERMEPFGARVEAISRFRSRAETREILEDTEAGEVDVLIGTHRLLSGDIAFDDLGLLVVDEEQRFGVEHKEKIKKVKANIDVLTLTATPIPRTLQMSLLGIRDLSIIATPPHNRKAVRTHVAKFSAGVVREAVMRELERGGQVFFVHNRVRTIDEMAAHLEDIVPEARLAVAHGQMAESELEDVMLSYIEGDINVLLCSTIIESGLDIPNANTIIVNDAHEFGLSQLYQLRGRVGRADERAYAYLLVPRDTTLNKDAEKRLEVLQRHSELGSGFHVATYDLEIRGAGNLLGEDQSGHVTDVGLDMYTELLEEAIHDLQDRDVDDEIDPEVNIPVEAFIPENYIDETSLRLMFYKRFSLTRSQEELVELFDELTDRFGPPPEPVDNLRDLVSIKVGCRQLRATQLDAGPSAIRIQLREDTTLAPDAVADLIRESHGDLELTDDMNLLYSLDPEQSAHLLETSRELIDRLLTLRRETA